MVTKPNKVFFLGEGSFLFATSLPSFVVVSVVLVGVEVGSIKLKLDEVLTTTLEALVTRVTKTDALKDISMLAKTFVWLLVFVSELP